MPRKSNISQPGTGEEHNTPAKEKADGVNIEVSPVPILFNLKPIESTNHFFEFQSFSPCDFNGAPLYI